MNDPSPQDPLLRTLPHLPRSRVGLMCRQLWYLWTHRTKIRIVTADKRFWGGYEVGPDYTTTRLLFLCGNEFRDSIHWPLNGGRPIPIPQFQQNPARYPGVTEIPPGTRFKIVRIQKFSSITDSSLEVFARFITGPCPGTEVDLCWLSRPLKTNGEMDFSPWRPLYPVDAIQRLNA